MSLTTHKNMKASFDITRLAFFCLSKLQTCFCVANLPVRTASQYLFYKTPSWERTHKQRLQNKERGFTLLELMIVAAIMAVMAALIIPNINFSNPRKSLSNEALRLQDIIALGLDTALIKSKVLAVEFTDEGYVFYTLNFEDLVLEPYEDNQLREYNLPENISLDIMSSSNNSSAREDSDIAAVLKKIQQQLLQNQQALAATTDTTPPSTNVDEASEDKIDFAAPQLWLWPSGEMTAMEFELFHHDFPDEVIRLAFSSNGALLEGADNEN